MRSAALHPNLPDTFSLHEGERRALQIRAAHALDLGAPEFRDRLNGSDPATASGPGLCVIPAGVCKLGAAPHEVAPAHDAPRLAHAVTQPFALGSHPVTTDEFECYARASGWRPRDELAWLAGRQPVINVRLADALAYCDWLSAETGQRYRLPTEAEWEYACRAGAASAYPHGDRVTPQDAHYNASAGFDATRPKRPRLLSRCFLRCGASEVGKLRPNCWGLYDMSGNVWEFTASAWTKDRASPPEPARAGRAGAVVTKGGSWFDGPEDCRAAARRRRLINELDLNLGFRVLREFA
jgi:formylglycine-generating enzyme required for sulfatase activity